MEVNNIWAEQRSYLTAFNNVSLRVGDMNIGDFDELKSLIADNYYVTDHKREGMKIVELGCWTGSATCLLGAIAKQFNGSVLSVDDYSGRDNLVIEASMFNARQIYRSNIRLRGLEDVVKHVETDANALASMYADYTFTVVFIDTSYEYAEVKKTIEAWYPKIRRHGLICGYNADILINDAFKAKMPGRDKEYFIKYFPGVDVAVGEMLPHAKKTRSGAIWYERKD